MRRSWRRLGLVGGIVLAGCRWEPDTPLARAAAGGRGSEVQALLARGGDPNAMEGHGVTPLICAARNGHLEEVRALIRAGADPDLPDRYLNGWTPLMHAVHTGQRDAVRTLLEAGANPNVRSKGQATALIMAGAYGDPVIVGLLLGAGADPHAEAAGGATALSNAAGGGALFDVTDGPPFGTCHLETVKLLLARAPGLRLRPGAMPRAARWLRRGRECKEVAALLGDS